LKWKKIKFRAHGFYPELGWATNEKFKVKSPENFDVQSARRALKKHLDCVHKHERCNKFKKWPQRKKSQHSWCWAIGSVREKEDPSQPSNLEEGAGGLK
jgi:hypothetical protein